MRPTALLASLLALFVSTPGPILAAQAPAQATEGQSAQVANTEVSEDAVVAEPADPLPRLNKADVDAWLDGFMPYALQSGDIAGAVVVVVKNGEILTGKGYGFADVAERKPVDPATTLFRPGSVSKLLTWTAVMQLVEQGKIDLDVDVNRYLDFEIPARNGKPVTMRNIMTHTSGMEEYARALITADPDAMIELEPYLKHWVPTQIFDPGSTPAYSNYATSLAGYIVSRISGLSFDDYMDRYILQPLDMQHSTFRQPLPEALKPFMSKGYALGTDKEPKPFEIVNSAPAGSLSASGEDMGKFMIAHLQNGAYGSVRILEEETAKQMHDTALDMIPPLNRMLLGFYETNVNGHRGITHAGDTQWFHSQLNLFPDDGIGIFLSVNSTGKEGAAGPLRTALFHEFADRYLPGSAEDGSVDAETARQHAQQMAGVYENSRRSETGFVALANIAGQLEVAATEDGSILIPAFTYAGGQPKQWREIAPYVWREVGGDDRVAAKVVDGKVLRFSMDQFSPFMVFEPVPWWKSSAWLLPFLMAGLGALLLTVLAWPISAMIRRHYGVRYELSGRDARAHLVVRVTAIVVLAILTFAVILVVQMFDDLNNLSPANDTKVSLLRLAAMIVFPIATLIGFWNAAVVLGSRRRKLAKLWSIVLALSFVAVLWFSYAFSLIGIGANY
ncbi:serine hydrolase domain-containing protein [Dokdonella sp.]|uniref:serine hydrolase domain-containing protein n=1 Tax=Dokdonella sp. TaxID=2291710 RepID=UPI003528FFE6